MRNLVAILIVGLLLAAANSYASDTQPISMASRIAGADLIAEIRLISTEVVKASDRSQICGYAYHAKIIKSLKGQSDGEVVIYSRNSNDVSENYSDYFIISPKYSGASFFSSQGKVCSNRDVEYFTGGYTQSLFPIDYLHNLLANRTNIFTPSNYLEKGGYIKGFEVIDGRIWADLDEIKIISDINLLMRQ